ncbi:MAG: MarR family transcriptional regulator [Acidobacteriota bacterium]|nr:MarR family transcriptional regulator [Acidobacteriota bacterium]MDE3044030.1 MarR family transcriptional regulator [Acidobacteriota bacterium]
MNDTTTTTDTAARLRRAVTRLHRRLRATSLSAITPTQASVLATINKLQEPTLGDLAVAEQVRPPSITKIVRGMATLGLIETSRDPLDRRSTRVRLTPKGRRELEGIRQRKTEFLERRLAALSARDQAHAEELVAFLEALLEDE